MYWHYVDLVIDVKEYFIVIILALIYFLQVFIIATMKEGAPNRYSRREVLGMIGFAAIASACRGEQENTSLNTQVLPTFSPEVHISPNDRIAKVAKTFLEVDPGVSGAFKESTNTYSGEVTEGFQQVRALAWSETSTQQVVRLGRTGELIIIYARSLLTRCTLRDLILV